MRLASYDDLLFFAQTSSVAGSRGHTDGGKLLKGGARKHSAYSASFASTSALLGTPLYREFTSAANYVLVSKFVALHVSLP